MDQPGLVKGAPVMSGVLEQGDLRCLPTQAILWMLKIECPAITYAFSTILQQFAMRFHQLGPAQAAVWTEGAHVMLHKELFDSNDV